MLSIGNISHKAVHKTTTLILFTDAHTDRQYAAIYSFHYWGEWPLQLSKATWCFPVQHVHCLTTRSQYSCTLPAAELSNYLASDNDGTSTTLNTNRSNYKYYKTERTSFKQYAQANNINVIKTNRQQVKELHFVHENKRNRTINKQINALF